MFHKVETFVSSNGIKEVKVANTAEKVNELDRAILLDRKGNGLAIEAGAIYRCFVALSSVRNLTVDQYLAEFRKLLEEKEDEPKKPE